MIQLKLLVILMAHFLLTHVRKRKEISLIKETSQELEMVEAYKQAYEALEENDPYFAAKNF